MGVAASSPQVIPPTTSNGDAQQQQQPLTESISKGNTVGLKEGEDDGRAMERRRIHFCENTNDTNNICNAQWMMLYTAAAYAPDRLTSSQQKVYSNFFNGFIDRCEDPIIGGMIEDEIQSGRSAPRAGSNREMLIWLCTIENRCRQRLGMPMVQCRSSRLLQRWRYPDGYL